MLERFTWFTLNSQSNNLSGWVFFSLFYCSVKIISPEGTFTFILFNTLLVIYWLAIKISLANICQVLYNLNNFSCVILFNAHKIYTNKKKKKILKRHTDKWDFKMCFSGLYHYKMPRKNTLRRVYWLFCFTPCELCWYICAYRHIHITDCVYDRGEFRGVNFLYSSLMSKGISQVVRLGDIADAS